MAVRQEAGQVVWKALGGGGIAVSYMGDKINVVSKGDGVRVVGGGVLEEDIEKGMVLLILAFEV